MKFAGHFRGSKSVQSMFLLFDPQDVVGGGDGVSRAPNDGVEGFEGDFGIKIEEPMKGGDAVRAMLC